jgi:uncharacterized protein YqeY
MISDQLMEDLKKAMKSSDKIRVSVIRMLRSELKNAQIAAGRELEAVEEERVLTSYAKKRKESIETYRAGGREDHAEKETLEYEITVAYLPPRLEEEELRSLIERQIESNGAQGMKDFGRVMKAVLTETGSRADGAEVSKLLKSILASDR